MILRRYGTAYHSVQPNFNPTAITEIGFRRDRLYSVSAADFESQWKRIDGAEIGAEADGEVHRETERALLRRLEKALRDKVSALAEDEALVVENGRDDWPKTRERREVVVGELDNRFHFHWWVEPLLGVAVHRRRRE